MMTPQSIESLIEALEAGTATELEFDVGGARLRLRRDTTRRPVSATTGADRAEGLGAQHDSPQDDASGAAAIFRLPPGGARASTRSPKRPIKTATRCVQPVRSWASCRSARRAEQRDGGCPVGRRPYDRWVRHTVAFICTVPMTHRQSSGTGGAEIHDEGLDRQSLPPLRCRHIAALAWQTFESSGIRRMALARDGSVL